MDGLSIAMVQYIFIYKSASIIPPCRARSVGEHIATLDAIHKSYVLKYWFTYSMDILNLIGKNPLTLSSIGS